MEKPHNKRSRMTLVRLFLSLQPMNFPTNASPAYAKPSVKKKIEKYIQEQKVDRAIKNVLDSKSRF